MVEPSNAGNLTPVSAPVADPAQAVQHVVSTMKHGPSPVRLLVLALIASGGLAWDLWSKHQVFTSLGYPGVLPGPGVQPVWKGQVLGIAVQFQLETAFNHGALWGMGQGQTWLFAALSFVAVGVIAYFLWSGQVTASKWLTVATGLLLAGTLGNLFDRLGLHGCRDARGQLIYAVRDFLDFFFDNFHWATFNFADTYLVTGAIMLVVHSFFPDSAAWDAFCKDQGSTVGLGIVGLLVGGYVGFLLRPSIPLIGGQLPFEHVITRGSGLQGMDQLLVPLAQNSFNITLAGAVVGTIAGALIGFFISRQKTATRRVQSEHRG